MSSTPLSVALTPDQRVRIAWSDGRTREYTVRQLRDGCPCAHCREARLHPKPPTLLPVLSPAELLPLKLAAMEPVGNYAYSIAFSDGHNTGIYTLEHLRELGSEVS